MFSADRAIHCPEFKDEIHKYLLISQQDQAVPVDFMKDSPILPKMRSTVVDWLVQVWSLSINDLYLIDEIVFFNGLSSNFSLNHPHGIRPQCIC